MDLYSFLVILIWCDFVNGHYSVRSGYNMLQKYTWRGDEITAQEDWKGLWKMHTPPKAKHLLWRICKRCLPTWTRLKERCVSCPLICPICKQYNEDDWHFLTHCNDSLEAVQTAGMLRTALARTD
jgi:hypothetical protein